MELLIERSTTQLMRFSSRHVARQPPSLSMSPALAVPLLLLGFVAPGGSAPCPEVELPTPVDWSQCLVEGKCSSCEKYLRCESRELPHITEDVAMVLEVLVVDAVGFLKLQAHHFSGLYHLLTLTLTNGHIKGIAEDAFQDLRALRHLDLSNNEIVEIAADTFVHNRNLRILVLDGNPLHVPSSDPLFRSMSLVHLSINGCGITSVNDVTFAELPALMNIGMIDNPLRKSPDEVTRLFKNNVRHISFTMHKKDDTMNSGDSDTDVVSKSPVDYNFIRILLISCLPLVVAFVLIGIYKMYFSRSNRTNSGSTVAQTSSNDRGRDYHPISSQDSHQTPNGDLVHVHNGVDSYASSHTGPYSYDGNVSQTTYYPRYPPPRYDNTDRVRTPDQQESAENSTSQPLSSEVSDGNV